MTDGLEKKVDEICTKVDRIESMLKYNGIGLIPAFQKHCESDECFRKDYYQFRKKIIAVFFFLLGSGALGVGGAKIAEVLAKGG